MKEDKQIELRSEKVRNIIGQVPPVLLRYGISIIVLSLLMLVGISAFIPYQPDFEIEVTVEQNSAGEFSYTAHIPEKAMAKKNDFDNININDASEIPFPKRFQIISISATTLITKDGIWHNAILIPDEKKAIDVRLENPVTIPARVNLKKISVLKWILNYQTVST